MYNIQLLDFPLNQQLRVLAASIELTLLTIRHSSVQLAGRALLSSSACPSQV